MGDDMSESDTVTEGRKFVIEQRDEIEIYVGCHGHVCIRQSSAWSDDAVVVANPNDIPQIIDYLLRAKSEAEAVRNDGVRDGA